MYFKINSIKTNTTKLEINIGILLVIELFSLISRNEQIKQSKGIYTGKANLLIKIGMISLSALLEQTLKLLFL